MLTAVTLKRGVRTLAERDRHLAAVVDRHGPPPLWARPPGFSTLTRIILEQQVTLASGRAAYVRLRQAVGGRVTPRSVAVTPESRLRRHGLTRQKAAYCRNLARSVADGALDLGTLSELSDEAARDKLVEVPGIGPWTADVYLLMALRRPDVWPDGDVALITSAHRVKGLHTRPSDEKLRRLAAAWSPWRAVAARILWHAYLCTAKERTRF